MHLVKRANGVYHFRLVLPKSLRESFKKNEVHHSLKTKKKRLATTRANQLFRSYMEMKKKEEEEALFYNIRLQLPDGTRVEIDQEDPEQELRTAEALLNRTAQSSSTKDPSQSLTSPRDVAIDDLVTAYLKETANEITHRTQTERIRALGMYTSDQIDQKGANEFSKMLRSKTNPKTGNPLSPTTINKYLALLGAFNTWLVNRGHVQRNYFTNLKIKRTKSSHLDRDPLSLEEIRVLLQETSGLTSYKHWLPRLALYTGCRLNELCQLYMEDVTEVDGLLCLKITDGSKGQHLKNLSSKRVVPIHPDIAEEFRKYLKSVEDLRRPEEEGLRVFPELTWTKSSYYSGLASNWYGRYRKTIGIDKSFHSLRHSFGSTLQVNSVDHLVIGELLGHAEHGETGRYTGKRPVGQLMDAIKTLKF